MDSKPVAPAKSDTVEVTIKSSGGGHTGIVIDSPVTESPANPQAPTRPPSITSSVVITLPPDSEVNDLKNSMTAVEKQGLQRTLEQQGISVSVDASAVH